MVLRTLTVSDSDAGAIIGMKGNMINEIERMSRGVIISVCGLGADGNRRITLGGMENLVSDAVEMICKVKNKRNKVDILSDDLLHLFRGECPSTNRYGE